MFALMIGSVSLAFMLGMVAGWRLAMRRVELQLEGEIVR